MKREWLDYPDLAPTGPTYTRAVRAGNTIYISGCTARGTDAENGSPTEQFKVTMDRLVGIVKREGGKAQDIVTLTTFVTSMSDWWPANPTGMAPRHYRVGASGSALPEARGRVLHRRVPSICAYSLR